MDHICPRNTKAFPTEPVAKGLMLKNYVEGFEKDQLPHWVPPFNKAYAFFCKKSNYPFRKILRKTGIIGTRFC